MAQIPASANSHIVDSVPPEITTLARPSRMALAPSPMPWVPEAQAAITVEVYPLMPKV